MGGEGVSTGPRPTGLLLPPLMLENQQDMDQASVSSLVGGWVGGVSLGMSYTPGSAGGTERGQGIGSHTPHPQDGALPLDAQGEGCSTRALPLHHFLISQGSHLGGPVPRWGFGSWGWGLEQGRGLAVVTPALVRRPVHDGGADARPL